MTPLCTIASIAEFTIFYATDIYCRKKTPVKILELSGNAGGTKLSLVYQ